jgi:DNA-binding transcriptional LysR family regulator
VQKSTLPPELPWNDVQIFLAVMRAGSVQQAAVSLRLDASTVSRRIVALETRLGGPLFQRRRTGLLATAEAEQLLLHGEQMEGAFADFVRTASTREVLAAGPVRITAFPGVADLFIAPHLKRLLARHPALQISLDAATQIQNLTRQEADIAVRSVPSEGAHLVTQKVAEAQWQIFGSPALVKQLGVIKDWSGVPWIDWGPTFASTGPSRWLRQEVPKANIVLRSPHVHSQMAAAKSGLGLLLMVGQYRGVTDLVPVKVHRGLAPALTRLPKDNLWLVTHQALRNVQRIAAVWDFLREVFRGLPRQ